MDALNNRSFEMATKKTTTTKKTVKKAPARKTAKVPTTSQVTAPKTARKKAAPRAKVAAKKAKPAGKAAKLTPEERYRMIEQAAYFIAERHGFQGDSEAFWVEAEKEVDARL
jgi:hypothetical protein